MLESVKFAFLHSLDKTLVRPGRLDRHVTVPNSAVVTELMCCNARLSPVTA